MGYAYQDDGSVICVGDADPKRTARIAGPRNSAAQKKAVADFFALEPRRVPNAARLVGRDDGSWDAFVCDDLGDIDSTNVATIDLALAWIKTNLN